MLHQRYTEFGPALAAALPRLFADDSATLARRRATLRLMAELLLAGVANDMSPLLGRYLDCIVRSPILGIII